MLCSPNAVQQLACSLIAAPSLQVEGFPPPEELKTVYVEHDLDDSEVEMAVLEYLVKWFAEKEPDMGVDKGVVVAQLNEVGFPEELQVRAGLGSVACIGRSVPVHCHCAALDAVGLPRLRFLDAVSGWTHPCPLQF
jgi:hypothetical protein